MGGDYDAASVGAPNNKHDDTKKTNVKPSGVANDDGSFGLFEGNFGSAFGNLANNPSSSSNGAQNGVFGINGDGGVADNSNTKVQTAVVATLHGTSKNEYGTNTIGYGSSTSTSGTYS